MRTNNTSAEINSTQVNNQVNNILNTISPILSLFS